MEIRRERKVITVLFVDLVGFTSMSEAMDPEDVEVALSRYHSDVRTELERFGGTVEKFIGDAVMAIFGAPVAHEDDAERAVRAALAVRDWATSGSGLEVRIGVNTGETLVRLGASAESGEGLAVGDVVNTTARLQTAAPTNGVIVGEATYRATRSVIDYEPTEPITAKGKAEPVPAWIALDARSRFGVDLDEAPQTKFVGRENELGLLRSSLSRARAEHQPQLVTLVGVPGIGKSRLLHELWRLVEADPELITWRQGRCLPYGDGVSMWALTEIVKAEAGIFEGDGPEVAEQKLIKAVETQEAASDPEWMIERLRPLIGVGQATDSQGVRGEQFTAWRQFLENLADDGPAVVIFEDLHWADGDPAGLRRRAERGRQRRTAVHRLHRETGVARQATGLGSRPYQRTHAVAPTATCRAHRRPRRRCACSDRRIARAPAEDPRPGGGKSAVRRGVRPDGRRERDQRPRPARLDSRHHCRPPRHPRATAQANSATCRRDRKGVLGNRRCPNPRRRTA